MGILKYLTQGLSFDNVNNNLIFYLQENGTKQKLIKTITILKERHSINDYEIKRLLED